jgi:large subunit ribosomal protein L9
MEVILLQDVDKVGLRGEVVSVARGYMRNYLAPRRLAEEATPARVAELEKRDSQRARHEAASFDQAQEIADKLSQAELRFDVNAGPQGTLFGSVTATDIADEIWKQLKVRVDRRKIDLEDSIKRVGRYQIPIEVFTDVSADVKIMVVPEGGELPNPRLGLSPPPRPRRRPNPKPRRRTPPPSARRRAWRNGPRRRGALGDARQGRRERSY